MWNDHLWHPARGCSHRLLQSVHAGRPGDAGRAYRLSKRQIQQLTADLFGLTISTGMISKLEKQSAAALAEPYDELARSVLEDEAVNIDETGWREDRHKAWLWVTVTALATVFTIARHRSAAVARRLLGDKEDQVVSSDRFKSYDWLWAYWRQVCWSHLRRDFQAMIDRGGPGEAIGRQLLELSDRLFAAWHRPGWYFERASFQQRNLRLMPQVKRALEEGTKCRCASTAGTCTEILRVEEGLWNFVWFPGVEPTNNVAERTLRHAVIWRRTSGGTASESGSRFVERMLTVVATCRQQGRNVLEYLTSCFEADRRGQSIPSLLLVTEPAIKAA